MHIILVLAKGKFETREFVSIKEACEIARRHRRTIDRWLKEGRLIPCYVGDEVCIREDLLRAVMGTRKQKQYEPAVTSKTPTPVVITPMTDVAPIGVTTGSANVSPISEYQYVPDADQVKD